MEKTKSRIKKIENKASYGLSYYEHGQAYLGSHRGMRFRIARDPMDDVALMSDDKKGEANFEVTIWPEPYCYEKTEEDKKTTKSFPFSVEGKEALVAWLNQQYEERYEEWESCRAKH